MGGTRTTGAVRVERRAQDSLTSAGLIDAAPVDIAELVELGDIECECMLCHLPFGDPHPPIEWRYTVRFPGPYPKPGESTMLLCDPCKRDWEENQGTLMGHAERLHKV